MSMETLLATTIAHSPTFDPALALGRIHDILSALIQHCSTRAAYLYTGCFTCELQIRSGGDAYVPPVVPDYSVRAELRQMWELVPSVTDTQSEDLVFPSLSPVISELHLPRLTEAAEPLTAPNILTLPPLEYLISWTIIAPFALYCAFSICYDIFWKVLPIATFIFQIIFFFHFVFFSLIFSAMFCMAVLASC